MNKIKNSLIVFAALSALSIFIGVLTPRSIQGQGGVTNKIKDESTREPVTISLGAFHVAGQEAFATDTFVIPEGKRLVVEHLYGNVIGSGNDLPEFWLRAVVPGQGSELSLPLAFTTTAWSGTGDIFTFCLTQPVRLYVANPTDDGKSWGIDVFAADHGNGRVVFSGYLEPLP